MHSRLRTVSAAAAFFGFAAGGLMIGTRRSEAANDQNPNQDEKLKIQIGQQIAPVHLDFNRKEADTVYLGSYLVNATGCSDCHTNPSYIGNPFAGDPIQINAPVYLAGGRSFGPGVVSRNITPDATGKPAGMSYSEFVQAMRNGKDFDNIHPLLQVMPWPRFRNLTDRDMQAIYQYLSAIPCREGDPGVDPMPPPRCGP
jgi:hypothetical protein